MDIVEKFRLALLQLQKYSDNELIIIEGKTLNIEEELKIIKTYQNGKEHTSCSK